MSSSGGIWNPEVSVVILQFPRDAQRADIAEEAGHFLLASAQLTGMIQQHIFASQDVPERFQCQILSFVRIQWPDVEEQLE